MNKFTSIKDFIHANYDSWIEFLQIFNLYLSSENMIFDNLKTFRAYIKTLHEHVLSNINVVIITFLITGEDYLCLYFHPNMIIIKKAAKVQKFKM